MMEHTADFDKLLDSITKQQQHKTDLEVGIRQSESRRKTFEAELGTLKRKEEYLKEQIPSIRADVAHMNAAEASRSAELVKEKGALVNLENNLNDMRKKVQNLKEAYAQEQEEDNLFLLNTKNAFDSVIRNLAEATVDVRPM